MCQTEVYQKNVSILSKSYSNPFLYISYIDLTNNGNFGYNGKDKMIREIKKHKGTLIFINVDEYENNRQTEQKKH